MKTLVDIDRPILVYLRSVYLEPQTHSNVEFKTFIPSILSDVEKIADFNGTI